MFPKPSRTKNPEAMETVRRQPCVVCQDPSDPCHIRSRGAGGPDEDWNLLPLCRKHHTLQHTLGWRGLCARHPQVKFALEDRGWTFVVFSGGVSRLMNDRLPIGDYIEGGKA